MKRRHRLSAYSKKVLVLVRDHGTNSGFLGQREGYRSSPRGVQQDDLRVAWHTDRVKYRKLYTADALRGMHVDAADKAAMESSSHLVLMLYHL